MEKTKKKLGLTHSVWAKAGAFILCILMLCVTALSVAGVVLMFNGEVYWTPEENVRENMFLSYVNKHDYSIVYHYPIGAFDEIEDWIEKTNIDYVRIECGNEAYATYEYGERQTDDGYTFTSNWAFSYDPDGGVNAIYYITDEYSLAKYSQNEICTVEIGISKDIEICDELFWMDLLVTLVYGLRFWIYAIGLVALILAIPNGGMKNALGRVFWEYPVQLLTNPARWFHDVIRYF